MPGRILLELEQACHHPSMQLQFVGKQFHGLRPSPASKGVVIDELGCADTPFQNENLTLRGLVGHFCVEINRLSLQ